MGGTSGYGGIMSRARLVIIMLMLCELIPSAIASGKDPTHGATSFVIVPAGVPWHPIGPAKQITTWSGPFRNVGGHPANVYIYFTKESSGASQSVKPLPNDLRAYPMMGIDFYYPKTAHPRVAPKALGYTADGFSIADKLSSDFPAVAALFPGEFETSSCRSKRYNYSLLVGEDTGTAYLVSWQAPHQVVDVAYLPAKILKGSLNSILDNMNYYEQGGMYELMRFGSLSYYLSRVPLEHSLGRLKISRECPDTPTATATGISTPEGWTKALSSLRKH